MLECKPRWGEGWGGKTKSVSEASRGSKIPTSEADGAGVPVEIVLNAPFYPLVRRSEALEPRLAHSCRSLSQFL